ncbi:MAG: trigger factor [Candidatus Krumholzibacteriota bacterium]|nr:trigger factor [Candidatus Krumholzibacteriota bacterium]
MQGKLDETDITIDISHEKECRKVVSVEVARERFLGEKETVANSIAKEAALPGFRKGKAPKDLIYSRYADAIHAEAIKSILPIAYERILATGKLRPLGEPVFSGIEAKNNEPLRFTVEIETVPEIEIEDYRELDVPVEPVDVPPAEIDDVLGNIRERNADFVDVERPAAVGDVVVMDYAPVGLDDKPDEEKRVTEYAVQLGAGQLMEEFELALTGAVAGKTGRVDLVYPADYKPEHLAGRTVPYEFTVRAVKEKRLPALDDAFAAKVDEKFTTLDELRADVGKRLREEKEKEARRVRQEKAIDLLLEKHPFEVPKSMVERFTAELRSQEERRREAAGVGAEEDEERRKQLEEILGRIALRNIRRYFLIEHVVDREKVDVAREDLEREYETIAEEAGRDVAEVRKAFAPGSENLNGLRNHLRERKVFGILLGETGASAE